MPRLIKRKVSIFASGRYGLTQSNALHRSTHFLLMLPCEIQNNLGYPQKKILFQWPGYQGLPLPRAQWPQFFGNIFQSIKKSYFSQWPGTYRPPLNGQALTRPPLSVQATKKRRNAGKQVLAGKNTKSNALKRSNNQSCSRAAHFDLNQHLMQVPWIILVVYFLHNLNIYHIPLIFDIQCIRKLKRQNINQIKHTIFINLQVLFTSDTFIQIFQYV